MKKFAPITVILMCCTTVFAKSTVSTITQKKDKCIESKPYIAGVNECLSDYLEGYQKILYQQKGFSKTKKSVYLKAVEACDSGDILADRPQIYECQIEVTEKAYHAVKARK